MSMRATSTQSNEDIQALQRGRRIPQLAQHDRAKAVATCNAADHRRYDFRRWSSVLCTA